MKKNYVILVVLLIVTVLLTLFLSDFYKIKNKKETEIYKYAIKINKEDFENIVIENSDLIIYISDKYNNEYKDIEKTIINKIDLYDLKNYFIYIDEKDFDNDFLNKFNLLYNTSLNLDLPILITISDRTVNRITYINEDTIIYDSMFYEVFE